MKTRIDGAADGGNDEFELGGSDDEIEEAEADAAEDAGGEDADGEDAAADDEGDEGQDEEEVGRRQPERRENRYQKAIRERAEERARANGLEQRLQRLESQRAAPAQPDPAAAQRQEQQFIEGLRMMDPVEAAITVRDRERQLMGQALRQIQAENLDRQDKSDFNAAARSDQAMARLQPQVEAAIAQARQMGNYGISRMDLFYRIYGEEMATRRQGQGTRQARDAGRRVRSQTTRPASGRGEASRDRRPAANSAEADDAAIAEAMRRGVPLW